MSLIHIGTLTAVVSQSVLYRRHCLTADGLTIFLPCLPLLGLSVGVVS